MKHTLITFLSMTALLVCLGCSPWFPPAPPPGPLPGLTPQQAWASLAQTGQPGKVISAFARIEVSHGNERLPLKAAILIKSPSCLRVEGLPVLGPPSFFLALTDRHLRVFLPSEGKFFMGRADRESLAPFLALPIPPRHLVSLLAGSPPDLGAAPLRLEGKWEDGFYRIDRHTGQGWIQTLWMDPHRRLLIKLAMAPDGAGLSYTASFDDYVDLNGLPFPRDITIQAGGSNPAGMTVRYQDLKAEEGDDPALFDLPLPESVTPIDLDA